MSFFEFVEAFNTAPPFAKRRVPHVPRIVPQVFCYSKQDLEKYHDWCLAQLRIYRPHEDYDEVEQLVSESGSVELALRKLMEDTADRRGMGPQRLRRDWARIHAAQTEAIESQSEGDDDANGGERPAPGCLPDWARAGLPGAAGMGQAVGGLSLVEDWTEAYTNFGAEASERMKDFIASERRAQGDIQCDADFSDYDPGALQGPQVVFFELLKRAVTGSGAAPVRAIIRGGGGVGKSYTINCFRRWLAEHSALSSGCALVLAPTGTAAFNVSGFTLHSKLRLPVPLNQSTFQKLAGPALTELQETFRNVTAIIVDEMSMVGRRMLRALDDRLRQAKSRVLEPFGGLSIFLCGDFGQLPPVADVEMYSKDKKGGALSMKGVQTWRAFTHSIELTVNHRQKEASHFRDSLWRLRCGELTMADYEVFASRGAHVCNGSGFDSAPYLVPTHELEDTHNREKLQQLGEPVYAVHAVHCGGKRAKQADDQDAGGLQKVAYFARGARVMLRKNMWTPRGLTNGAIGEFVAVVAPETDRMPLAALVRFPAYTGPSFFAHDPKLVPVPPHTAHFGVASGGVKALSRTQLPLQLSWAITIHKAQGQTYDKCIVNLGHKEGYGASSQAH